MNSANSKTPQVEIILVLDNGVEIPKIEHDDFWREINDALPWLPAGVTCRIDHLVTPRFWLSKNHLQHRLLGRVLAYWVTSGKLPLKFVGDPRRGNKRYRRKT